MPQREVIHTFRDELEFDFAWPNAPDVTEKFGPTYGRLTVRLKGNPVWPAVVSEGKGIAGSLD